jgi:hypothetical protein
MFPTGPSGHRKGQVCANDEGLWITLAQGREARTGPAASVQNPGRADPNRIEALHHALFDLAVKIVRIGSPRRAPVELTPNGSKAQAGHGVHRIKLSTEYRNASMTRRSEPRTLRPNAC